LIVQSVRQIFTRGIIEAEAVSIKFKFSDTQTLSYYYIFL